jgi:hypothetical protein
MSLPLVLLYRNCGNLARATWRPTSGEVVVCHRGDNLIVVETTIHHADKSSDDTSRHLRVSIATEVTTCDSPPRLSSDSNRSPSDLIWSTPFSPPSHSATVSIRGRISLSREPKLATLVETFHPPGLREPKFVSIPVEPASAFRRNRNCNAARDINLVSCTPLRGASAVYRGAGLILRHRFRGSCFATSTDLPGDLVDQVETHQTNICNPPILFSKTSRLRHLPPRIALYLSMEIFP